MNKNVPITAPKSSVIIKLAPVSLNDMYNASAFEKKLAEARAIEEVVRAINSWYYSYDLN